MVDDINEMPAGDKEVSVSVIVEVHDPSTPFDVGERSQASAGRSGHIVEVLSGLVLVERGQLSLVGCDVEIEPSVVVPVGAIHTHISLGIAERVVGNADERPDFFKSSLTVIHPEGIGSEVVGDEEIGVAIIVEIGGDHPHSGRQKAGDPGLPAHITEGAIPIIAEEVIGSGWVLQRTDVRRESIHDGGLVVLQVEVDVARCK